MEAGAHFEQARNPAIENHAAFRWRRDAREDLEQRALARSIAADDHHNLAAVDGEGNISQRPQNIRAFIVVHRAQASQLSEIFDGRGQPRPGRLEQGIMPLLF